MTADFEVIKVPSDIEDEVQQAIAILRQEMRALDPAMKDSDIVVERQDQKGMLGGGVGEVLLYFSGAVVTGITERWVEEVLWPKVKPTIKKHSDKVLDFLLGISKKDGARR